MPGRNYRPIQAEEIFMWHCHKVLQILLETHTVSWMKLIYHIIVNIVYAHAKSLKKWELLFSVHIGNSIAMYPY